MNEEKIRVGISSCLLGEEVRYDGGHKLSRLCTETLGRHFDFVSICPEVGIGMGVPRKPIRLVGEAARPRAVGVEDPALDLTRELRDFARRQLPALEEVCGYIFIRGSPSCGLFGVKVFGAEGRLLDAGARGVYAREITRLLPELPVEEAGRLENPALRDDFVARVHALHERRRRLRSG